jgi:hypothetical protein
MLAQNSLELIALIDFKTAIHARDTMQVVETEPQNTTGTSKTLEK